MYTMVLMMAATSGGDTTAFGGKRTGCHGAGVVAVAPAGCYGSAYGSGSCFGSGVVDTGCYGGAGAGCTGGRGGFLGLRNKDKGGNGCTGGGGFLGGRGGFLGGRGGSSCHGVSSSGCHGAVVVAAPACGGCSAPVAADSCGGCGTTMVASAPVMGGMMMSGPIGCPPGVVTVGSGVPAAVTMPAAPMGEPVKKEEPKKEEPKKEEKKVD